MAYYEGAYFEGALYEGIEAGEAVARSAESSVDGLIQASITASASIDALVGEAPFWYDTDWGRRERFLVNSDYIDEDLENFRVLLKTGSCLTSEDFWDKVASDGADIVVTTDDGITRCPVDLFSIDTVAETIELYFLAPEISSSSDTSFYLYYDNPSATAPGASDPYGREAVWDSSVYKGVYHWGAFGAGNDFDSSASGNDPTSVGAAEDRGGLIGNGIQFNGSADANYVYWSDRDDFDFADDSWAIQLLLRTDYGGGLPSTTHRIFEKGNENNTAQAGYGLNINSSGRINMRVVEGGSPTFLSGFNKNDGVWERFEFGIRRSTGEMFVRKNGTSEITRSDGFPSSLTNNEGCLIAGAGAGNNGTCDPTDFLQLMPQATIDEVRILRGSGAELSDAYSAAEASNFLEDDFLLCGFPTGAHPSVISSIDAIIAGQFQTATIDALIKLQASANASIDAAVQAQVSESASIDAIIRDLCGVYPNAAAASNSWDDVAPAANTWAQKAAADNEWVGVDPVCED